MSDQWITILALSALTRQVRDSINIWWGQRLQGDYMGSESKGQRAFQAIYWSLAGEV